MAEAVIVEAVRSPVGKRNGGSVGCAPGRAVGAGAQRSGASAPGIDPAHRRRRHLGLRHAGR